LWNEPVPLIYVPLYQRFFPEMVLHVRADGDPMSLLPSIRLEIEAIDNDLPLFDERPLSAQVDAAMAQQRTAAYMLSAAGMLSLVLSTLGVYGILSYWVLQRRREIAIRMSLGAKPGAILWLVLRKGLVLAICGIGFGASSSLLLNRFLVGLLHGVSPSDRIAFLVSVTILVLVSLIACLIPAVRATRTEPMTVLRQE
jgi:ABC-type antimicrobial peptide transport system permease subunit